MAHPKGELSACFWLVRARLRLVRAWHGLFSGWPHHHSFLGQTLFDP